MRRLASWGGCGRNAAAGSPSFPRRWFATCAFAPVQPLICYSLKTNPNLSLCRLMREAGAGFDVTSGGELYRALKAGGTGDQIVFAGVGKTDAELRYGLDSGVFLFNVESEAE